MAQPAPALLTVGHGRLRRDELGRLLAGVGAGGALHHGVGLVVDVRRFPGSRSNPDVARDALGRWLPDWGIGYRWEERLGGRRRAAQTPEEDTWWREPAFRAYAAYTRTEPFGAALDLLLGQAALGTVAIMCSESMWWRCHRRLIADVASLSRGVPVQHVMPDGRLSPHRPADGARVRPDGHLIWNGT